MLSTASCANDHHSSGVADYNPTTIFRHSGNPTVEPRVEQLNVVCLTVFDKDIGVIFVTLRSWVTTIDRYISDLLVFGDDLVLE
jgi:hypothetical protein